MKWVELLYNMAFHSKYEILKSYDMLDETAELIKELIDK